MRYLVVYDQSRSSEYWFTAFGNTGYIIHREVGPAIITSDRKMWYDKDKRTKVEYLK